MQLVKLLHGGKHGREYFINIPVVAINIVYKLVSHWVVISEAEVKNIAPFYNLDVCVFYDFDNDARPRALKKETFGLWFARSRSDGVSLAAAHEWTLPMLLVHRLLILTQRLLQLGGFAHSFWQILY